MSNPPYKGQILVQAQGKQEKHLCCTMLAEFPRICGWKFITEVLCLSVWRSEPRLKSFMFVAELKNFEVLLYVG